MMAQVVNIGLVKGAWLRGRCPHSTKTCDAGSSQRLGGAARAVSCSARRLTDRVVGENAGVLVQHEPAKLPALHDVSPLAEETLHDGHVLGAVTSRHWR